MFGFGSNKKKVVSDKELKQREEETEIKKKKREPTDILKNMSFFMENYTLMKKRADQLLKISLLLGVSTVVCIGISIFLFINRPTPVYFAVTPDLKLVKLASLSQPYINDNVLKSWLVRSINDTLAIDFRNYERTLLDARKFFTQEAHTSLISSMQQNNIIKHVREKRVIVTPIIQKAPIILDKGNSQGIYMWQCELEVTLSYEGSNGVELTQPLVAEIWVQRTSTLDNSEGINIRKIIFREKGK